MTRSTRPTGRIAQRVAVTAVEVARQRAPSLVAERVELWRELALELPWALESHAQVTEEGSDISENGYSVVSGEARAGMQGGQVGRSQVSTTISPTATFFGPTSLLATSISVHDKIRLAQLPIKKVAPIPVRKRFLKCLHLEQRG